MMGFGLPLLTVLAGNILSAPVLIEDDTTIKHYPYIVERQEPKRAIALVDISMQGVVGNIWFDQWRGEPTHITGYVSGLPLGDYGVHIHELGVNNNNCTTAGGHFNPDGVNHGAPGDARRHVGDLGNLHFQSDYYAVFDFADRYVSLSGANNVIGRSLVIHKLKDDFGRGGDAGSRASGNAGARVACAVIKQIVYY